MITLNSCPNCKDQNIAEYKVVIGGYLVAELMPGVKVDTSIITRYTVCNNCRLIFQNPRLSDNELDKYYASGYYRKNISKPPEGMEKGEENRAKIDAEIIKKYVGKIKSHLDLGCGMGYLLREVGAEVKVGVESDVEYVKAKGIEIYSHMDQIPQKSFDLVSAVHVLEHLPYPLDYLKRMTKFVAKNGFLLLEVPSWKTRGGSLGFAHLSHFESSVLRGMCLGLGLSIVHEEFTPHFLLICKKS